MSAVANLMQARLQAVDSDPVESHLFEDSMVTHPASDTDALWQMTNKIYNEARRCFDNHLDESAWMKVINSVLDSVFDQDSSMLRVHSIQTQSIDSAFLPKHDGFVWTRSLLGNDFAFCVGSSLTCSPHQLLA